MEDDMQLEQAEQMDPFDRSRRRRVDAWEIQLRAIARRWTAADGLLHALHGGLESERHPVQGHTQHV